MVLQITLSGCLESLMKRYNHLNSIGNRMIIGLFKVGKSVFCIILNFWRLKSTKNCLNKTCSPQVHVFEYLDTICLFCPWNFRRCGHIQWSKSELWFGISKSWATSSCFSLLRACDWDLIYQISDPDAKSASSAMPTSDGGLVNSYASKKR